VIHRIPGDPFPLLARLIIMRADRMVAWVRRELRERLMAERADGVDEVLGTLWALAQNDAALRSEHARWAMRFELLATAVG
jgi:hypothetical protein